MSTDWFSTLTDWVKNYGGQIHHSLRLQQLSSNERGIFAKDDISKGTLLIRIPQKLTVSGESMPLNYNLEVHKKGREPSGEETTSTMRTASPWLRSIAALLNMFLNKEFEEYISSLPESYETLLHESSWSNDEVKKLLSGTSVGRMVLHDRENDMLRSRFDKVVEPYLLSNGLIEKSDDEIFAKFKLACACISTRGFHLRGEGENDNSSLRQKGTSYSGPFLLPFIDLLNHTSKKEQRCTTLQRQTHPKDTFQDSRFNGSSQVAFVMVAERDIAKGEEIFHSYGDNLTAGQLLQTFGFVEETLVERAATLSYEDVSCHGITPCVLSRDDVIEACGAVASSSFTDEIVEKITSDPSLEDFDVWDLPEKTDTDIRNSREVKDNISEDIIINHDNPLSDELITLGCIQFLPSEAYDEIYDNESKTLTVLSKDILEDYFLGNLVLKSIQFASEKKMLDYGNIEIPGTSPKDTTADEKMTIRRRIETDQNLLIQLIKTQKMGKELMPMKQLLHSIYGLTIRIEEMICLEQLNRECNKVLGDDQETLRLHKMSNCDRSSKRIKL